MSLPISIRTVHCLASLVPLRIWLRRFMVGAGMVLVLIGGHWVLYFMSAFTER